MKLSLFAICFLFATCVYADDIVVFAKHDTLTLTPATSTNAVSNPAKAAFLTAVLADLAKPVSFTGPDKLADLPEFGRHVEGAAGEIKYHQTFTGGLVLSVSLEGLLPNHQYILTLNGNPERPGNDKLMETVSHNEKEKYYDFQTITTDATGRYHASYGIMLPSSPYEVRFYVKDTKDFKIVLYHDFFKFVVQ